MASKRSLPIGIGLGIGAGLVVLAMATHKANASEVPKLGDPTTDFAEAKRLAEKWRQVFPRPSVATILAVAAKESRIKLGVAPNLEGSDGERGGAWGVMQVTLQTAVGEVQNLRAMLRKLKDAAPKLIAYVTPTLAKFDGTGKTLADPDVNMMIAVFYLNRLMKEFDNDSDLAVAAYNRGAGGVKAMEREAVAELPYVQAVNAYRQQIAERGIA